jgi:hypothetical protein
MAHSVSTFSAVSCVLIWRGTWVGWDVAYDRFHEETPHKKSTTQSGMVSHVVALTCLLGTGLFASVLAPPAAVSVIRDLAVKTGQSTAYMGPASRLFEQGTVRARALSTQAKMRRKKF